MKNKKTLFIVGGAAVLSVILASSIRVGANDVTIDENLSVSQGIISFQTVFPGEVLFKPLNINLSDLFLQSSNLDDVEYRILQKPKPRVDSDAEREYCAVHPTDYTRCYPSLCPYLSKTPDSSPANDRGVEAFHDPASPSSIATGRLAKSENDTEDNWVVDLHTPCFRGQCDQSSSVTPEFQLDPGLNGQVFGCDLVVDVTSISFNTCEEPIDVVGGVITDPAPLHITSYADLGSCNFTTSHDVIVEGPVVYPGSCTKASITAGAINVKPTGSIAYNGANGTLILKTTGNGITAAGSITSASNDPIRLDSREGIFVTQTLLHNTNNNGDLELLSESNMLVASSTLMVGPPPPATSGGDILRLECSRPGCVIEILDSTLRQRALRIYAKGDIIMRNTTVEGRDPRCENVLKSFEGKVDLSGGICGKRNRFTNQTEGSLEITAKEDVLLDDIYLRIPRDIRVTAGAIISMLRADISNDFGKSGDILMSAGVNVHDIKYQDVKLLDDNDGFYDFAKLNGSADPNPAQRALHHVIGVPLVDN